MRILTRFILSRFLGAFFSFFLFFTTLFILVELFELRESASLHGEMLQAMVRYLGHRMPFLAYASAPVAVVLSTIFVIAARAHLSEIVAAQAGGITVLRYTAPITLCAALLSVLLLCGSEFWIPDAADKADRIRRVEIQKKEAPRPEYVGLGFTTDSGLVLADRFIPAENLFESVTIVTPAAQRDQIESVRAYTTVRLDASGAWVGTSADGRREAVALPPPQLVRLIAGSSGVRVLQDKPLEAQKFSTLIAEIRDLSSLGNENGLYPELDGEIAERFVNIHAKIAFPLTVPFLALLGAGIGARVGRRRGFGSAIGSALLVTLGYMMLLQSSLRLGTLAAHAPAFAFFAPFFPWGTPVGIGFLAWRQLAPFK
jgi:lipopolysaccharide export LptBFGC system permease protein LptF